MDTPIFFGGIIYSLPTSALTFYQSYPENSQSPD